MTNINPDPVRERFLSLVKKAWKDNSFRRQLLSDPRKVIQKETGYEIPPDLIPEILEEKANEFFFVLPPKPAKGLDKIQLDEIEKVKKMKNPSMQHYLGVLVARSWQDEGFRKQLVGNSRAAIRKEFGLELPKDVLCRFLEADPGKYYFVLPAKPADDLSDEELEAVSGGTGMNNSWLGPGSDVQNWLIMISVVSTLPNFGGGGGQHW